MAECNQAIEKHLGTRPDHFAYPGGEWDPGTEAFVARYYKTARLWTCEDRQYSHNTYATNPYRLESTNVSMHMPEKTFLRLLDTVCDS